MPGDTAVTRTLAQAVLAAGGHDALAQLLAVSCEQLESWLCGECVAPQVVYFKALDLVAHSQTGHGYGRPG